ncbi:MAG: hypothetical protein U0930_22530 [Pirellulales bacterium]
MLRLLESLLRPLVDFQGVGLVVGWAGLAVGAVASAGGFEGAVPVLGVVAPGTAGADSVPAAGLVTDGGIEPSIVVPVAGGVTVLPEVGAALLVLPDPEVEVEPLAEPAPIPASVVALGLISFLVPCKTCGESSWLQKENCCTAQQNPKACNANSYSREQVTKPSFKSGTDLQLHLKHPQFHRHARGTNKYQQDKGIAT